MGNVAQLLFNTLEKRRKMEAGYVVLSGFTYEAKS